MYGASLVELVLLHDVGVTGVKEKVHHLQVTIFSREHQAGSSGMVRGVDVERGLLLLDPALDAV